MRISKRRVLSLVRLFAGPLAGCAAGLAIAGPVGALIGALLGSLVSELYRRSGFSGSLAKYLGDPGAYPSGPPVDEPFIGASALAGFAVSFDTESILGVQGATAVSGAGSFERVAVTRIALEEVAGLTRSQRQAFSRLAQSLLSSATAFSASTLLRSYFGQESVDPLPGAVSAWALFKARWPQPSAEAMKAMREFLKAAACPEGAIEAAERAAFPERAEDWEILGLKPGASQEEIKKSFRKLSLAFHPDGFSKMEPERRKAASEAFMKVREAYKRLLREKA